MIVLTVSATCNCSLSPVQSRWTCVFSSRPFYWVAALFTALAVVPRTRSKRNYWTNRIDAGSNNNNKHQSKSPTTLIHLLHTFLLLSLSTTQQQQAAACPPCSCPALARLALACISRPPSASTSIHGFRRAKVALSTTGPIPLRRFRALGGVIYRSPGSSLLPAP